MSEIGDSSVALRVQRALQIRGARFPVVELDDTIVPVVVVDNILPTDPRVPIGTRRYSHGRSSGLPLAGDHACFLIQFLPTVPVPRRIARIHHVTFHSTGVCDVVIGFAPSQALTTTVGLLEPALSWNRIHADFSNLLMTSGSLLAASLPVLDADAVWRGRVATNGVLDLGALDISMPTQNGHVLWVFADTAAIRCVLNVEWDETEAGLG